MKVILHSDEVNLLIYRYLQESGFLHTAFTFCAEADLGRPLEVNGPCSSLPGTVKGTGSLLQHFGPRLPPNCLISMLHKALLYCWVEHHTDPDSASEIPCDQPFGLFNRHYCRKDESRAPEESDSGKDDPDDPSYFNIQQTKASDTPAQGLDADDYSITQCLGVEKSNFMEKKKIRSRRVKCSNRKQFKAPVDSPKISYHSRSQSSHAPEETLFNFSPHHSLQQSSIDNTHLTTKNGLSLEEGSTEQCEMEDIQKSILTCLDSENPSPNQAAGAEFLMENTQQSNSHKCVSDSFD